MKMMEAEITATQGIKRFDNKFKMSDYDKSFNQ